METLRTLNWIMKPTYLMMKNSRSIGSPALRKKSISLTIWRDWREYTPVEL